MSNEIIIILSAILLAIVVTTIRIYYGYVNNNLLLKNIKEYYKLHKDLSIVKIRNLKFNEIRKYRATSPYAQLIFFGFFNLFRNLGDTYYRIIDGKDSNDNEQRIVVKIFVRKQEIIKLEEIETII